MRHVLKDKKETLFTNLGLRIQSKRMRGAGLVACRERREMYTKFWSENWRPEKT